MATPNRLCLQQRALRQYQIILAIRSQQQSSHLYFPSIPPALESALISAQHRTSSQQLETIQSIYFTAVDRYGGLDPPIVSTIASLKLPFLVSQRSSLSPSQPSHIKQTIFTAPAPNHYLSPWRGHPFNLIRSPGRIHQSYF